MTVLYGNTFKQRDPQSKFLSEVWLKRHASYEWFGNEPTSLVCGLNRTLVAGFALRFDWKLAKIVTVFSLNTVQSIPMSFWISIKIWKAYT